METYTTFLKFFEALDRIVIEARGVKEEMRNNLIALFNSLGWVEFLFLSEYYGSHGDTMTLFFFHPSVDFSRWVVFTFSHGYYYRGGGDEKEFWDWINGLKKGEEYVIIPQMKTPSY